MTNEEVIQLYSSRAACRAEALRRVALSDDLFAQYNEIPADQRHEAHPLYNQVCHARQTAAVYAALAAAPEGDS